MFQSVRQGAAIISRPAFIAPLPSFRRPQCLAFRDGLNTRSTRRFSAYPREHRRAVALGYQQQRLHNGQPFFGVVFGLRQLGDVFSGIAKRDQLLALL